MGPAKAAGIKAAFTLAARFQSRKLEHLDRFTSPRQVFDYFHHEIRDACKEYFLILLLDGKNRIIRRVQISEGSLIQSIVHPREVFSPAVKESAAAIILVHNHSTGDPAPSSEISPSLVACGKQARSWASRYWIILSSGMASL
jgi:DNA repair protein RadC